MYSSCINSSAAKKKPHLTYIHKINMSRYIVQHGIILTFFFTSFLLASNQVVDAIHDRYVDVPSYEGQWVFFLLLYWPLNYNNLKSQNLLNSKPFRIVLISLQQLGCKSHIFQTFEAEWYIHFRIKYIRMVQKFSHHLIFILDIDFFDSILPMGMHQNQFSQLLKKMKEPKFGPWETKRLMSWSHERKWKSLKNYHTFTHSI